jgi:hypothetical protein
MLNNTMLTDEGMRILSEQLGIVEAERFITLLRREPFDYTKWRQRLFTDVPLETFLENAQKYRDETESTTTAEAIADAESQGQTR